MKMRRSDRQVTDSTEILNIIKKRKVCRIGFFDESIYIVPLNFGIAFEDNQLTLFFHGALEGRKANILNRENTSVGIEMDYSHKLIENELACEYSHQFESLIGHGFAEIIDQYDEKINALNQIMHHQTGRYFEFDENHVNGTLVFKVTLEQYSVKRLLK